MKLKSLQKRENELANAKRQLEILSNGIFQKDELPKPTNKPNCPFAIPIIPAQRTDLHCFWVRICGPSQKCSNSWWKHRSLLKTTMTRAVSMKSGSES